MHSNERYFCNSWFAFEIYFFLNKIKEYFFFVEFKFWIFYKLSEFRSEWFIGRGAESGENKEKEKGSTVADSVIKAGKTNDKIIQINSSLFVSLDR